MDNSGSNIVHDVEFLNFAVENINEMFGYINTGRVSIRIHKYIKIKMWLGGHKHTYIHQGNTIPLLL